MDAPAKPGHDNQREECLKNKLAEIRVLRQIADVFLHIGRVDGDGLSVHVRCVERGFVQHALELKAVVVDAIVRIRPGERVPLDGVVTLGQSAIETWDREDPRGFVMVLRRLGKIEPYFVSRGDEIVVEAKRVTCNDVVIKPLSTH